MASQFDVSAAIATLIKYAHPIRVELTFIVIFSILWFVGHSTGLVLQRRFGLTTRKKCRGKDDPAGEVLGATRAKQFGVSPPVERPVVERLSAEQLRDPQCVIPRIVQLCQTQFQRALDMYYSSTRAGLNLQQASPTLCEQLFLALVTSAIRIGQADEALRLLQDFTRRGGGVSTAVYASAIKLCTSKHLFDECLQIYQNIAKDPEFGFEDKTVWSCLLFCSMEAKSYHACRKYFANIKACGTPSTKDYGHMVRFASIHHNWQLALQVMQEMRANDVEIDSIIYNTVLATCVASDQIDEARRLLDEMGAIEGVTDVITYNTLMKGYAKADRMAECFEIYELMGDRKVEPSQVTYGVLLDGCINANRVDKAMQVFERMTREGCKMNTVLFTTLIKGFVRAGEVDQAMKVYEKMVAGGAGGVSPDLITYSILIKANCDAGGIVEALRLFEAMIERGLRPDEVVFNNLLTGCVHHSNVELAKKLYKDMLASRIQPTNATFSIMIRLYAQCKALEDAVELLRTEPACHKQQLEPRLFNQLIQCCLRERQGRRAMEVYELMCQHVLPPAATHSGIIAACVKLNMYETAVDFLSAAATHGARVNQRDADIVLQAARRKNRTQCIEACVRAMHQLGLSVR